MELTSNLAQQDPSAALAPASFSAAKILEVWETGRQQHELDRALTILLAASPNDTREELAGLTIGDRDTRLLRLRASLLGAKASGFAECPKCAEHLEFEFDTAALTPPLPPPDATMHHQLETNGAHLRFRVPTSRDLAEVVALPDPADGLLLLARRCVVEPKPADEFSGELMEALGRAMLEADPQAEISLALECPNCGDKWQLLFDIADFFWRELSSIARRILDEIDVIARAYGWSERDILSLPARRRQTYLELITE